MNFVSILLLLVIVAAVVSVVVYLWKHRGTGCNGCSGCNGCTCGTCGEQTRKKGQCDFMAHRPR